jgi:hypothetical protein
MTGAGVLVRHDPPPLVIQEHLLIRSKVSQTGFKGVRLSRGRYKARCTCHQNHLGCFGTPEEAAQVYLKHYQTEDPEEMEKEQAKKRRKVGGH